jgi:hypothetical protein
MSLELKRKKLELMRVTTARHELEFKIEEKQDEIKRIQDHIKVQRLKEAELGKEIHELEKKGL